MASQLSSCPEDQPLASRGLAVARVFSGSAVREKTTMQSAAQTLSVVLVMAALGISAQPSAVGAGPVPVRLHFLSSSALGVGAAPNLIRALASSFGSAASTRF